MSEPLYRIDPMDHTIANLLGQGMTDGIALRSELVAAEAALRRAQIEVAIAEERVTVIRDRYERNRTLATDMWSQLKAGLMDESRRVPAEPVAEEPVADV